MMNSHRHLTVDCILWTTIIQYCYPQHVTHGVSSHIWHPRHMWMVSTLYTRSAHTPRPGYTLFSTGYIHGILHPQDMIKVSTVYIHGICVHRICHVVHSIWCRPHHIIWCGRHPICCPRYTLHRIKCGPHHMSTGYTQLYPVDIWCGHMVWTTYGVGALRHADEGTIIISDFRVGMLVSSTYRHSLRVVPIILPITSNPG